MTPRERRSLVALAIATLVPFILLAAWARVASPAPWEPAVLDALALGQDLPGDVVRAINTLGNLPVWAVVVGILAVAIGATRGLISGLAVALSFASDIAAAVVKIIVERERPETVAVEHFIGPDSFAFPSGHVVRAVALAAIFGWIVAPARWRLQAALGTGVAAGLVMGYARVALNVHWPTDALGGLLLGLGWLAVTAWSWARPITADRPTDRRS